MERNKGKKNKGITLIALIITIIILLILVAVTLDIAVDGKLFDKAQEAVNKTNNKVGETQDRVDELTGQLEQTIGSMNIKLSYVVENGVIKLTARTEEAGSTYVSISGAEEIAMTEVSDTEYYTEYTGWAGETYTFKVRQGEVYNSISVTIETGIAKVEPENIEDWRYTVNDDGTITINLYSGSDTEVVFPNSINGKRVVAIEGWNGYYAGVVWGDNLWTLVNNQAYMGHQDTISKVVISEGIERIGYHTFYGSLYLQEIYFPRSCTFIGGHALGTATYGTIMPLTIYIYDSTLLEQEDPDNYMYGPLGDWRYI